MYTKLDLHKLADLIKDIKFPMFTTLTDDGAIISRPMAGQEIDEDKFDGTLWFFTKKDTAKVHSIERDSNVNLTYSCPEKRRYVSISGTAFLNEDKNKIEQLWSPTLRSWFPEGPSAPDLCLIGIDIQSAEVWDTPPGKIEKVSSFIKSMMTGRPIKTDHSSQHIEVNHHHEEGL